MRQSRWKRRNPAHVRPGWQDDPGQPERRAMILKVVENQLRDNNPPETRATLQRLMAAGNSRDEALRLIGCALAAELYEVVQRGSEFDPARYLGYLRGLPAMPWDKK